MQICYWILISCETSKINGLRNTVFPLISTTGAYLILKLCGAALIGGRHLNEGGPYFKVREIIRMKFQNFVIFSEN